jgi:hypothetical protein
MINKAFDQINKDEIDVLVVNKVKEGRPLEYKEKLPGGTDGDKKEFLADVSSFANAAGGDLLYGVKEERDNAGKTTGIPESVPGLPGINADAEIRRLENMIRDGIKPRIAGARLRTVDGFASGPVLLIRIPKSYAAPHMVTFQDHSRFYSRNSSGKYALDVGEIRAAFALSESVPERVRHFRDERLARIVADETPVLLPPKHIRFVLHVLPSTGFDPTARVDITPITRNPQKLRPLAMGFGCDSRFNLDGYLAYVPPMGKSSTSYVYTQLFRNGAIEAVEGGLCEVSDKPIRFGSYEQYLIDGLDCYLKVQQELELQPPVFVLLALVGVKGCGVVTDAGRFWARPYTIDRDLLVLPDVLVEDYAQPLATILRPIFDAVWQSAGWPGSPNYTRDGRWELR